MERFEGGQTVRHPIMYAELKGGAFSRGGGFDISYVKLASFHGDMEVQILSDCLEPWNGNKAEAGRHRDRLSERTSHEDDAIVGPCGKNNRKRLAEMTSSCLKRQVTKAANRYRLGIQRKILLRERHALRYR